MEKDEQDKTADYVVTLENSYGRQLEPWKYLKICEMEHGGSFAGAKQDKKTWTVTLRPIDGNKLSFYLKAKKKIEHGKVLVVPASGRWRRMVTTNTETGVYRSLLRLGLPLVMDLG
eukprot:scaffold1904_cov64-Cylindrotheca_fusiformis.AAC.1